MRRVLVVAAAVVAVTSSMVAAHETAATLPGANGRITFLRWNHDATRARFLTVLPTGRGATTVRIPPDVSEAAWSPDGSTAAYVHQRWREPDRVMLVDTGSGDRRRLISADDVADADTFWGLAWAPTGTRLAMTVTDEGGGSAVYIVDADDGDHVEIGGTAGVSLQDWSSTDVLLGLRFGDRVRLVTMHPSGSGTELLLRLPRLEVARSRSLVRASWAPDGGSVAFVAQIERDRPDIFVVDADGSNLHRVRDTRRWHEHDVLFAPRGDAFVVTRGGPSVGAPVDLWILDPDEGWRRVTDTPERDEHLFDWLPR